MPLETLLRGWVSRALPQPEQDNEAGIPRLGRYGEIQCLNVIRKQHQLADEGTYFVFNNSGTGVATAAAPTAFSDTAPFLTINNTAVVGNTKAKRIYLDWLRITQTAVGTAGVDFRIRGVLDTTVPTGGTVLTPLCPNMDEDRTEGNTIIRLLPTGIAQTNNSRIVIGTLQVIPTKTAPMTALDEFFLNFGGVEANYPNYNIAASANVHKLGWPVLPIVIGPGQVFMLEFLITSQSGASSWTCEGGLYVR